MISGEVRLASIPPRLTHWGDGVRRAISIVVTVSLGAIGTENADFFGDPRVKAAFAERGLDLRIRTAGIATSQRRSSSRIRLRFSALERQRWSRSSSRATSRQARCRSSRRLPWPRLPISRRSSSERCCPRPRRLVDARYEGLPGSRRATRALGRAARKHGLPFDELRRDHVD